MHAHRSELRIATSMRGKGGTSWHPVSLLHFSKASKRGSDAIFNAVVGGKTHN